MCSIFALSSKFEKGATFVSFRHLQFDVEMGWPAIILWSFGQRQVHGLSPGSKAMVAVLAWVTS